MTNTPRIRDTLKEANRRARVVSARYPDEIVYAVAVDENGIEVGQISYSAGYQCGKEGHLADYEAKETTGHEVQSAPVKFVFKRVATHYPGCTKPAFHDGVFIEGPANVDSPAVIRALEKARFTTCTTGLRAHWVAPKPTHGKAGFHDNDLFGKERALREALAAEGITRATFLTEYPRMDADRNVKELVLERCEIHGFGKGYVLSVRETGEPWYRIHYASVHDARGDVAHHNTMHFNDRRQWVRIAAEQPAWPAEPEEYEGDEEDHDDPLGLDDAFQHGGRDDDNTDWL